MKIKVKKIGDGTWGYIIYLNNEQICCGGGYATKGRAVEVSFNVAMTYTNRKYESKFFSQTKDTFVYSILPKETFDFGKGPVPAHQHKNGGGWVADTAHIDETVFVGPDAQVYEFARVRGFARICDHAKVYDYARVLDQAIVCDSAKVYGCALVFNCTRIYNHGRVKDNALVYGYAKVSGQMTGDARAYGCASVKKTMHGDQNAS